MQMPDRGVPEKAAQKNLRRPGNIFLVGSSTGGVHILSAILENLDEHTPPLLIAQHMPNEYTGAFAAHLNQMSRVYVKEAENGDRIYSGHVFIAPGNYHILLRKDEEGFFVELNQEEPVNLFRPSVDVLFESAVPYANRKMAALILTGMGSDGAEGLLKLRRAGAVTIAQDEKSSAVFGMPKVAIARGAAELVENIEGIISFINSLNAK